MRCRQFLVLGLLAFAACAPSATTIQDPDAAAAQASEQLDEVELHGRWRIVELDGRTLNTIAEDRASERMPHVVFSAGTYGGNTGCNAFGGLGVLHGDRYYAGPAMQTAIGCGDLDAQESAIIGLLTGAPHISLRPDSSLTLANREHSMLLRRDEAVATPPGAAWTGTRVLAGTHWAISEVDGRRIPEGQQWMLTFEADDWSLTGRCGRRGGRWRQVGGMVVATAADAVSRCAVAEARIDSTIVDLLLARPRFATGPNGEFLLGGGGHWVVGERPRNALSDDSPSLSGNWQITAINGQPPLANAGSRLAFGATGYSGSAGCNSMQGYYLAYAGRFYSAPPMQTEMACVGPVAAQEELVAKILASGPRVASAGDAEIEILSESGSLRLRRDGEAEWAPEGQAWSGEPVEAELTMIGGTALQNHYSEPVTQLELSPGRFQIRTGCGRMGGIWRQRGSALEFYTDAEPEPRGECASALAQRHHEFMRMFNGPARAQIGASGELLIAGEQLWLAGRVVRPSRRR